VALLPRDRAPDHLAACLLREPGQLLRHADGPGKAGSAAARRRRTRRPHRSTARCNGRASDRSTAPTQQTVLRDLGDAAVNDIAARWAEAWQAGDVNTIVAMLADDARYSMPPLPVVVPRQGRDPRLPAPRPAARRWRFLPTRANGQVAFGTYLWDDAAAAYIPGGLDVLTLRATDAWQRSSPFLSADLTRFGLPERVHP